jgi:hypothetical protein
MARDDDLSIFRPRFGRADRAASRAGSGSFRNAAFAAKRLRGRLSAGAEFLRGMSECVYMSSRAPGRSRREGPYR